MRRSLRISFRKFERLDLSLFSFLSDEQNTIFENANNLEMLADKTAIDDYSRHACVTTMLDGKPLLIAGYYKLDESTAHCFILPDRRIKQYPKAFVHATKCWLRWLEGRQWCERIQTTSIPAKLIDRWMEALGFVCEETLNGYTEAGQDYKLWSRVKLNGVWGTVQKPEQANGPEQ